MKKITLLLLTLLLSSMSWRATAQFFEGFESGIPASWTVINGGDANTWVHFTNAIFVHEGTGVAAITYSATAHDDYLITPPITVQNGVNERFSFFARSFDPLYPENFDLKVSTTTPTATAFTTTLANIAPDSNETAFTQYTFDLSAYVGQTIYIGMHSTTTDMWRISVDNVVSDSANPLCAMPSALSASGITTSSADLNWTAGATETSWNIEWGIAPFAQGSGTVVNGVSNPNTLSGLASGSQYSYYVQAVCGTSTSAWVGPYSFTTLCDTENVPYSLDFNSVTTPNLPLCTENVNEGTGYPWATTVTPTTPAGFTGNVLRYAYNSTEPANTWFFTNGLNLTAGTSYSISYKYANNSTIYAEKLKVAFGTAKNGAAMTNVIADYPNIQDSTLHSVVNSFTPATTGVYYIGFHAYSDADMFNLYVDDIQVYVTPDCPAPTNFALSSFDATTATFSWTAGGTETAWELIYGAPGFDPATAGTVVPFDTNPDTLTGLTDGSDYDAYIRAVCSASLSSAWVGPLSWSAMDAPDCASNPTPADGAVDVPVGTVQFMWDPAATGGPAESYDMYYGLTATTVTNFVGNFTETFVDINLSGYSTEFFWMIVPINAAGEATGCAIWSFTTQDPPPPPVCTVTENFNDGLLPAGWSNVANSGTCTWQFGSGDMPTGPDFTDFAVIFNDDACGGGEVDNNATLTSAVYDLTGATTAQLSFEVAMQDYATAGDLTVEVYNGTAWQQIAFYTDDLAAINTVTFDVLTYANANFQVRFTFDDSDDWGWGAGIDDFCLNTDAPALGTSVETISGFQMYPNPVANTLNLKALNTIDNVNVYNMLGQVVLTKTPATTDAQLDMSNLPTGSYIVRVQSGNQVGSYNLIKN